MARKRAPKVEKPTSITVPFTVLIDSNEAAKNHRCYTFGNLVSNVDQGSLPLIVPTLTAPLGVGDYSILGHRDIAIERKSKADFFGSLSKRENFESRLAEMSDSYDFSGVVVECEWSEILSEPYEFSSLHLKSIIRTVFAWQIRYHVQWFFMPNRDAAEQCTFRLLERYYIDHKNETLNRSRLSVIAFREGIDARLDGAPVAECPYKPNEVSAMIWEQGWRYADKDVIQRGKEQKEIRVCNGSCFNSRIEGKHAGSAQKLKPKTDIHSDFIVKKKG